MTDDAWLLFRARMMMLGRRDVLAEFEAETIRAADDRVRDGLGVVTPAERLVIRDALDAMIAAGRQDDVPGLAA